MSRRFRPYPAASLAKFRTGYVSSLCSALCVRSGRGSATHACCSEPGLSHNIDATLSTEVCGCFHRCGCVCLCITMQLLWDKVNKASFSWFIAYYPAHLNTAVPSFSFIEMDPNRNIDCKQKPTTGACFLQVKVLSSIKLRAILFPLYWIVRLYNESMKKPSTSYSDRSFRRLTDIACLCLTCFFFSNQDLRFYSF